MHSKKAYFQEIDMERIFENIKLLNLIKGITFHFIKYRELYYEGKSKQVE